MSLQTSSQPKHSIHRRIDRWFRRYHGLLGWVIVAIAVLGTIVLGTIGLEKNLAATAPNESYSLLTTIFKAFQMLTLNEGGAAEPISWELNTARLFAMFLFSAAVLKTAASLFHKQFAAIALRFSHGHTIICGAGEKGALLAHEFLDEGDKLVVVDTQNDLEGLDALRERGVYEVSGDAASQEVLIRAGVHRAKRLVIVSGTDTSNVQIAAIAREACNNYRTQHDDRLSIYVHCTDPRLFSLLEPQPIDEKSAIDRRDECRRFDITLNAARAVFDSHSMDRKMITADSALIVQIILLGYSREAQAVLLQVAKLGHFANLQKPRVIIIDPEASTHFQRLVFRYPQIVQILQLETVERDLDHATTMVDVGSMAELPDTLTTIVIAPQDEELSLQVALALPAIIQEKTIPVLIRLKHRETFGQILLSAQRLAHWSAFGSFAETVNARMVISAELDQLAETIHFDYVRRRKEEGYLPKKYPAMLPWDELTESYREANRQQADHISVKLRSVSCVAINKISQQSRPEATWSQSEIEILSKMEHQRWNANRWLEGWQYGPRDDSKKLHPNLVPWEELDEPTREYDRKAVQQIPALLNLISKVIVRQELA